MTEDRSMFVQRNQVVKTQWIAVESCVLGNRARMDFAAIERAGRRYLQADEGQVWPPIVGHWDGLTQRFYVDDGRHEFLALLALGKEHVLVAWLETEGLTK